MSQLSIVKEGCEPERPVALIQSITLPPKDRRGHGFTIAQLAVQIGFRSPAVIVIGETVRFAAELACFGLAVEETLHPSQRE